MVRWEVLEIYTTPSHNKSGTFALQQSLTFSHLVGAAMFATYIDRNHPVPASTTLRLCINCPDGLLIYRVLCDVEKSLFSLDLIWQRQSTPEVWKPIEQYMLVFRPSLGVTGGFLSCLRGDVHDESDRFTFLMEKIPPSTGSRDCERRRSRTFERFDANMMLVQSAIGVRDVDEARGLVVFGNVYGELCLYDFSNSPETDSEGCFKHDLHALSYSGEDLLPTVSNVFSKNIINIYLTIERGRVPIFPFPYNGAPQTPDRRQLQDVFDFWGPHQDIDVLEGWSTNFEDDSERWEFFCGQPIRGGSRTTTTFYGRPIPLVRSLRTQEDTIILDMGGLSFLWERESAWEEGVAAVHPTLSIREVMDLIQTGQFHGAVAFHPRQPIEEGLPRNACCERWMWEVRHLGRKRWREMFERGGKVHPELLECELKIEKLKFP